MPTLTTAPTQELRNMLASSGGGVYSPADLLAALDQLEIRLSLPQTEPEEHNVF